MKKQEILDSLKDVGVERDFSVVSAYFKSKSLRPGDLDQGLLLEHAEAIANYQSEAQHVLPAADAVDLFSVIEGQSVEVRGLGEDLRPWVQRKAEADAGAIADVLTSYGPLVMNLVQQRITNDPFGAEIANFRSQIKGQLAGVATDVEALPPSSEG